MATPTSTSSIEYEDEDSAAINSAYRKQQCRPASRPAQDPNKSTPNRPPTSRDPPTVTPPREPYRPGGTTTRANQLPATAEDHAHTADSTDTGNKREPPTAGSTAPRLAPLAPPVASWPTCAGSKSSTNQPYPSRYTPCMRGHQGRI